MLNWTQLVTQGRAKDIGIAWSDEEQEALTRLVEHTGLTRADMARFVRDGIFTVEEYEAANNSGKIPATRAELEKKAKEAGVVFDPIAPDAVLEKATAKKLKPKK